jgi:hypothetical protein
MYMLYLCTVSFDALHFFLWILRLTFTIAVLFAQSPPDFLFRCAVRTVRRIFVGQFVRSLELLCDIQYESNPRHPGPQQARDREWRVSLLSSTKP